MGKRKVTIRFVNEAFAFFESLADHRFVHRPCQHPAWKKLSLRCVSNIKKCLVNHIICFQLTGNKSEPSRNESLRRF
jgi:hypothetical protein